MCFINTIIICPRLTPFCRYKKIGRHYAFRFLTGRSGETRTHGFQYPKLARYHLRYTSIALLLYSKVKALSRHSEMFFRFLANFKRSHLSMDAFRIFSDMLLKSRLLFQNRISGQRPLLLRRFLFLFPPPQGAFP